MHLDRFVAVFISYLTGEFMTAADGKKSYLIVKS